MICVFFCYKFIQTRLESAVRNTLIKGLEAGDRLARNPEMLDSYVPNLEMVHKNEPNTKSY